MWVRQRVAAWTQAWGPRRARGHGDKQVGAATRVRAWAGSHRGGGHNKCDGVGVAG